MFIDVYRLTRKCDRTRDLKIMTDVVIVILVTLCIMYVQLM